MTRTEKENLVPVWERITIRYKNVRERSECKGRAVCAWSRRCNDHARYLCDGHERPEETRNHSL